MRLRILLVLVALFLAATGSALAGKMSVTAKSIERPADANRSMSLDVKRSLISRPNYLLTVRLTFGGSVTAPKIHCH